MFGKKPAVGQKLTYSGYGRERIYNVVAVVKIPSKSHIRFDIVYPMEAYGMGMMGHNWDHFRESIHVYVKMKAAFSISQRYSSAYYFSRSLRKESW